MAQVKNGLINSELYKDTGFASTDIKESITRPSFYIEFEDNKTGSFNSNSKERTTNIKIYYFPKDRIKYKLELMDIQDYLENIFLKYVKINDGFYVNVNELDFDIVDGVLICSLELYILEDISEEIFADTVQSKENENNELMEDIEIN